MAHARLNLYYTSNSGQLTSNIMAELAMTRAAQSLIGKILTGSNVSMGNVDGMSLTLFKI